MQHAARPPSLPTAAVLETALRQLGYLPGRPPSYSPMSAAVDASTARKMVCPACKRKGLGAKHYHKGEAVRCVCVCPACLAGEEV